MNDYLYELPFTKNPKRYKIAPNCPCGKDNRNNKFVPFEGFTDKGYCHSCGESFWPEPPTTESWKDFVPLKERNAAGTSLINRESKPITAIPLEFFEQSVNPPNIQSVRANSSLFLGLFSNKKANIPETKIIEAMDRFYVGFSEYKFFFADSPGYQSPEGANVLWLIDEEKRIRGGQVVLFDPESPTCSTMKRPDRHTRPVYLDIKRQIKKAGQPIPDWLKDYEGQQGNKMPCLFGLPQLQKEPINKPIAICEAFKTAIIGWIYCPEIIWLAIGSKGLLKSSRLRSIAGRNVMLFPDLSKDGSTFDLWEKAAAELQKEMGGNWSTSRVLEDAPDLTGKERKGGDLADYLLTRWDWKSFQETRNTPSEARGNGGNGQEKFNPDNFPSFGN